MPDLKTYDLFLSHAWRYNDDYYRLEKMLKEAPLFKWRNYSVPVHDPLIDPNTTVGKAKLTELLDRQVRPVNCVIIIGGMYAAYSEWILKEIKLAQSYNKPIIAVYPWGQLNMPKVVQDAADELVNWQTSSIVSAIRRNSI
ncbi:MAG: TIR domain-containing protein [Bacteroidetes bacterium]|nr:TIR domain-containing protein [Bacteroidota bacterium]